MEITFFFFLIIHLVSYPNILRCLVYNMLKIIVLFNFFGERERERLSLWTRCINMKFRMKDNHRK